MPDGHHGDREDPAQVAALHACFTALVEGRDQEIAAFAPAIQEAARALFDRHAELEHIAASPMDTTQNPAVSTKAFDLADTGQTARSLPIHTTIGAFTIAEFLGHGATGEVYRAHQTMPSREVALKMLFPEFAGGRDLHREAETLASLEHPSIARLYQTGEVRIGALRRRWIAMQYVPGKRTLSDWGRTLDVSRASDIDACIRMMISIADAVAFAHGRGIIHRDLKPSNILVDLTGHPVLIDFGVAKLLALDPQQTMHALGPRIVGTLAYAAPESLDVASPPDVRVDVFALGAMLYELLAQRPFRAFHANTLAGMMHELHANASTARRLATVHRAFRGDLDRIVAKATATDPSERYRSASQFAEDLRRHLAGEPVLAELQSTRERFLRAIRRHRRAVAIGSCAAAVLVATTSISLSFAQTARHEARLANLSAAARAIDAGDLMLVEQHAAALSEDDGSIERAIIDRALGLRGTTIALGDWYAAIRADATSVLAVGYPPGTADGPILARFEPNTGPEHSTPHAHMPWRRTWAVPANRTVTNSVATTKDGSRVAFVDRDGGLTVVDAANGTVRASVPREEPMPNSCAIAIAPDGTIAVARGAVELRSIDEPDRVIAALELDLGNLRAVAFSPTDPSLIAVAGHLGAVLLAHAENTLKVITRFETPKANQVALRWMPDGNHLALAGWDRTVRLYDPRRPKPLWTARGHHDAVWSLEVEMRTDPPRLLSASADGSLRFWRIDDGSCIAAIPFSDDIVWSIAGAPDGSLVSASQGALSIAPRGSHDAWVGHEALDPNSRTGRTLRIEPSTETRSDARLVDLATSRERALPVIPGAGPVTRVAIAPNDATALVLREDGTLSLVEINEGRVRWSTTALRSDDIHEAQGIPSLALEGVDQSAFVASRQFGCVRLDARDGSILWRHPIGASCTDVAASFDGTSVFAADRDGLILALAIGDGHVVAASRRQRTRVSCMAVTEDGARLITGGADGTLRILDSATLEEQLMLQLSAEQLRALWIENNIISAIDRAGILRIR
jgi:serine/threonine protein kinase/WD40 repeat protein